MYNEDASDFADVIDFEDFGRFVYEYLGFDDFSYYHTGDNDLTKPLGNEEAKREFEEIYKVNRKYRDKYYEHLKEIKALKELLKKLGGGNNEGNN